MINPLKKQSYAVLLPLLCCLMVMPVFSADIDDEEKGDKWDVTQPQGELKTITIDTIDTIKSTWPNLSDSQDWQTIAIDMLDDIYTGSINVGEGKPLVHGFDWNMQPAYSPDGKSIAFISDRDGSSNLWVMDSDGGNPHQISTEMITHTMINGRLYDVTDMSEIGSGISKIEPLFFERLDINAMPAARAKALEEKSRSHHWVH